MEISYLPITFYLLLLDYEDSNLNLKLKKLMGPSNSA